MYRPIKQDYVLTKEEARPHKACYYEDPEKVMHKQCVIQKVAKAGRKNQRYTIKYTHFLGQDANGKQKQAHKTAKVALETLYIHRTPRNDEELEAQKTQMARYEEDSNGGDEDTEDEPAASASK